MSTQDNVISSSLMAAMNPVTATAKSSVSDTQNRFMTLLVTQMKNQDPLNPMDNAQVTSQMAQLSTVTGIDNMNATLQSLIGSYQSSQSMQAASMIGHNVLTAGNSMALTNGNAHYGIELTNPVDSVQVNVLNSSGTSIRKIDVGALKAGVNSLQWDGLNDQGGQAANGNYTFAITATSAGQKVDATALSYGSVDSVSTSAQGVKLNVTGVGAANMTDVRQIL